MSRKSRLKKQEALRRRAEQVALAKIIATEADQPSINQLVLQRVDATPEKPHIAVAQPTGSLPEVNDFPENWPPCPESCNPLEWRRALENKEYYELAAIADDGKKPWFQYPRHQYQYSELVYCTPEMMQEVLKYMPVQRRAKETWADTLARDILRGRWMQSHESLAINTAGNCHDGQHRAKAIIKADKGWPIYITWNVPPEAIYVVDSGDKRKINEKLCLLFPGSNLTNKSAALCRAMMWGLTSRGVRYSETEIAEFAVKYQEVIEWLGQNMRMFRADLQAVIGKAILWWGADAITPFIQRLKMKANFTGDADPAKALYLWLQKSKQLGRKAAYANPTVYYKKTLTAVCAAATGQDAKKLFQKEEDIFEWEAGWKVPDAAPCKGVIFSQAPEEVEDTEDQE